MPDYNRAEYMTSYVPLAVELAIRPWGDSLEDADQYFLSGTCHVVHRGRQTLPEGAAWLPSLFDWLELLEQAGHSAIAIENVGDSGWLVYPVGDRDDSGAGQTREIALARLWRQVTR